MAWQVRSEWEKPIAWIQSVQWLPFCCTARHESAFCMDSLKRLVPACNAHAVVDLFKMNARRAEMPAETGTVTSQERKILPTDFH